MTIDFYYIPGSAPCRSVLMAAKAFNVDLNLKLTNLMAGEHMKPEFLKLNPQHCVPTLDDNGFVLWESRAILGYLADKYGKDDSFYPKDAQKRAQVNQQLYFDMGTLYQRFGDYYYPQIFAKQPANPELFKKMEDAVGFLDTALEGKTYVVGDHLTIADISLVASISTYDIADFDFSKYPNVQRWFEKCKTTIPGYELNQKGVEEFAHYLKDLKK